MCMGISQNIKIYLSKFHKISDIACYKVMLATVPSGIGGRQCKWSLMLSEPII